MEPLVGVAETRMWNGGGAPDHHLHSPDLVISCTSYCWECLYVWWRFWGSCCDTSHATVNVWLFCFALRLHSHSINYSLLPPQPYPPPPKKQTLYIYKRSRKRKWKKSRWRIQTHSLGIKTVLMPQKLRRRWRAVVFCCLPRTGATIEVYPFWANIFSEWRGF